jgi:hypothetical protein
MGGSVSCEAAPRGPSGSRRPAAGGLLSQDEAPNAQQFSGNVDIAMVPGLSHVEDPAGLAAVFNPFIECLAELQTAPVGRALWLWVGASERMRV